MKRIKNHILKMLLTEDEKYLLAKAVEDRVDNLYKIKVCDRSFDGYDLRKDISDYGRFRTLFSTKSYK